MKVILRESIPKYFGHIRSRLKTNAGISSLLGDGNDKKSIKFSNEEKASILEKHFCSAFTSEPDSDIPKLAVELTSPSTICS